jgi:uncharacterized protein (TIGR00255 family)
VFDTLVRLAHSHPAMKSMTGYGRGEAARGGFKVTVEVSSVNRKQSELQLSLPRELEPLDARVRDAINRRVARGRVTARVWVHAADEAWRGRVHLNAALARAYATELNKLARALRLPAPVTMDTLLRVPGVVRTEDPETDAAALAPLLEASLEKALAALLKTREAEGRHLARDLTARIKAMRRLVASIRRRAPQVARDYQRQLLERIRAAGLEGLRADDERVVKEVVFFADRADISEELTRLESHFAQFDQALQAREPVGRLLDFLAQEMGREINTLGSKANDATISRAVVLLKTELEKFREQAQNVE